MRADEANPTDGEGRRNRSWWFMAGALGVLAWLNCTKGEPGSIAFAEAEHREFEASRGWPFRWWTAGNDQGVDLVDTARVQGGVTYRRDRFPGQAFPHLFVDPWFLALDTLVALAFLRIAFVCGRPPRRQP